MRNILAAMALSAVGLGFAVSAQAAPASLAPLTTLNQSSIEQVQYHNSHCKRFRVCEGYGYNRHCHWVKKCGSHH